MYEAWLKTGDDGAGMGDLVLAVDFSATGRPDARFADLVELAGLRGPVWETMPQAIATDIGPSGETYLDRWADEVRADGREVSAVLGFCAGAVYATALAGRIAEWQQTAPQLVLFDPETANDVGLYWQFHQSTEPFRPVVGDEPGTRVQEAARRSLESGDGLPSLGAELVKLFREISGSAFDELELDAESRADYTESFSSFVAYIVAAHGLPTPPKAWASAVAFSSASPLSGLNRLRGTDPDAVAGLVAHELRFDSQHPDLLRDEQAAVALARLLAR